MYFNFKSIQITKLTKWWSKAIGLTFVQNTFKSALTCFGSSGKETQKKLINRYTHIFLIILFSYLLNDSK